MVDEPCGQDHCPPQALIAVADLGGTIAFGAGANPGGVNPGDVNPAGVNLAGVASCLLAKIFYCAASSRVKCCGLPDLLLPEILSVVNCRRAKIFCAAAASRVGRCGIRGPFLQTPAGIPGQEYCPLPMIVYVAGVYRVRAANFECTKIFYGARACRLAPCVFLDVGLKIPVEFLGWRNSVLLAFACIRALSPSSVN